jgi:putative membrane protein
MKKSNPSFLNLYLKGFAMGFAAIIPGISGGTVAYILGIYDQLIEAINSLVRSFTASMTFLLPIGLGVLSAIIALTFPIGLAFDYAPLPTVSLFAGLILGGLPLLRKKASMTRSTIDMITFVIPALIAMALGLFSVIGELDATFIVESTEIAPKFVLVFIGIIGVSAFIVPGISGSMLLLTLGFYEPILNSLEAIVESIPFVWNAGYDVLNFSFLGVGLLLGFILISWLMGYLLKTFPKIVYIAVFGFVVGSLFSVFVNYEIIDAYDDLNAIQVILTVLALGGGTYMSFRFNQHYAS